MNTTKSLLRKSNIKGREVVCVGLLPCHIGQERQEKKTGVNFRCMCLIEIKNVVISSIIKK
jgi:hypothetical protein